MIAAGIGCRRDCPAADIVAVVRAAEQKAACRADLLAAAAFKQNEKGLHEAAVLLAIPLRFLADDAMQAVQSACPTRSSAALRHTGLASVAEAAALAATGGTLILPRLALGRATAALAAQASDRA